MACWCKDIQQFSISCFPLRFLNWQNLPSPQHGFIFEVGFLSLVLTLVNMLFSASSEYHNELCFLQLANPISVDTVVAVTSSAALWKNIKNAAITTFKPWISQAACIQVIKVSIWGILLSCHKCRERSAKESVAPFVANFALESYTYPPYAWYCVWIYFLFYKYLAVFPLHLAPIKSQSTIQTCSKTLARPGKHQFVISRQFGYITSLPSLGSLYCNTLVDAFLIKSQFQCSR